MKDYYRILHVSKFASNEDIKRAYRRLALRFHPDVSKEPDAELKFAEVYEAYQVLNDPAARDQYNLLVFPNTIDQPIYTDNRKYRRNVVYRETKKTLDRISPVIMIVYKWLAIGALITSFVIFMDLILPNRERIGHYYLNYHNQNQLEIGDKLIDFELEQWFSLATGASVSLQSSAIFGFTRSVQFAGKGGLKTHYVRNNYFSIFLFLPMITSVLSVLLLSSKFNSTNYVQIGTANAYILLIQVVTILIMMHPFL